MIDWPEELVLDIAKRKCVLFLGAGVSKNSKNRTGSRPKDWKEFLTHAKSKCRKKALVQRYIKSGDYLTACDIIKNDLGDDRFKTLLRDEFLNRGFTHAKIHEEIFKLDARLVLTSNFDKIYDTYAQSESDSTIVVKSYNAPDISDDIRRPESIILKVHGTVDHAGDVILTRSAYAKARVQNSEFYSILEALLLTHTFVFIGCGGNDPDIRLLLENYSYRFRLSRRHFIVMPSDAMDKEMYSIFENSMHLKILPYKPKNNHSDLQKSIGALSRIVDEKRIELAGSMNW